MWSPVFEKMFSSEFKEKSASEIPLPGKNAAEIKELLLVIYPTSKPISENNCYFLLSLAREYQMEQLTERCEKYLLQREKTPHQAIDFLVLANEFNMEDLCKQCFDCTRKWQAISWKASGTTGKQNIEQRTTGKRSEKSG